MMRIQNNFCIKCNECGNVTLVIADDLDYETSVYDKSTGAEKTQAKKHSHRQKEFVFGIGLLCGLRFKIALLRF